MAKTSLHVQRAIDGDRQSLEWLVRRFQPLIEAQVRIRLGGAGTTQDREDLAADVWLVLVRRLPDLRARAGRYAPVLVSFLGATVVNTCNNWLRDRIRTARRMPRPADHGDSGGGSDLDRVERETLGVVTRVGNDELAGQIRAALERLGDAKRSVLVLRLLEQRTNAEIARILGEPPNTIAVRYRRALAELRGSLPDGVFADIFGARATRTTAP